MTNFEKHITKMLDALDRYHELRFAVTNEGIDVCHAFCSHNNCLFYGHGGECGYDSEKMKMWLMEEVTE